MRMGTLAMPRDGCHWPCTRLVAVGHGRTLSLLHLGRLIIRNGNNVEAPPVYDSYEVEYLPIEGLLSTGRHFFVELTTDSSGAAAGMALRYEGTGHGHWGTLRHCHVALAPTDLSTCAHSLRAGALLRALRQVRELHNQRPTVPCGHHGGVQLSPRLHAGARLHHHRVR